MTEPFFLARPHPHELSGGQDIYSGSDIGGPPLDLSKEAKEIWEELHQSSANRTTGVEGQAPAKDTRHVAGPSNETQKHGGGSLGNLDRWPGEVFPKERYKEEDTSAVGSIHGDFPVSQQQVEWPEKADSVGHVKGAPSPSKVGWFTTHGHAKDQVSLVGGKTPKGGLAQGVSGGQWSSNVGTGSADWSRERYKEQEEKVPPRGLESPDDVGLGHGVVSQHVGTSHHHYHSGLRALSKASYNLERPLSGKRPPDGYRLEWSRQLVKAPPAPPQQGGGGAFADVPVGHPGAVPGLRNHGFRVFKGAGARNLPPATSKDFAFGTDNFQAPPKPSGSDYSKTILFAGNPGSMPKETFGEQKQHAVNRNQFQEPFSAKKGPNVNARLPNPNLMLADYPHAPAAGRHPPPQQTLQFAADSKVGDLWEEGAKDAKPISHQLVPGPKVPIKNVPVHYLVPGAKLPPTAHMDPGFIAPPVKHQLVPGPKVAHVKDQLVPGPKVPVKDVIGPKVPVKDANNLLPGPKVPVKDAIGPKLPVNDANNLVSGPKKPVKDANNWLPGPKVPIKNAIGPKLPVNDANNLVSDPKVPVKDPNNLLAPGPKVPVQDANRPTLQQPPPPASKGLIRPELPESANVIRPGQYPKGASYRVVGTGSGEDQEEVRGAKAADSWVYHKGRKIAHRDAMKLEQICH